MGLLERLGVLSRRVWMAVGVLSTASGVAVALARICFNPACPPGEDTCTAELLPTVCRYYAPRVAVGIALVALGLSILTAILIRAGGWRAVLIGGLGLFGGVIIATLRSCLRCISFNPFPGCCTYSPWRVAFGVALATAAVSIAILSLRTNSATSELT